MTETKERNELILFENGLVPVYKTDQGEYVVDGRELWEGVQSKQEFANWIKKRFMECDAIKDVDFTSFDKIIERETGATKRIEYIIKLDTAKEMAMLERNEIGKSVRKYFIEIEKRSKQRQTPLVTELSPQLQLLINLELKQKEQDKLIENLDKRLGNMKEVVSLDANSWRTETAGLLNKIAKIRGGSGEAYRETRRESYDLLNMRMGVSLETRLTNKRRRAAENGVCLSARNKMSPVDVIAEDKKLIEGYVSVVKDMAIKYGVWELDAR